MTKAANSSETPLDLHQASGVTAQDIKSNIYKIFRFQYHEIRSGLQKQKKTSDIAESPDRF
jgi:hypothetical protein